MDEHALAGAEACAIHQVGPHGEMNFGQCRSLNAIDASRDGQNALGGGKRIFRIATAGQKGADGIAHMRVAHARADFGDLARDLEPERVGRAGRRRIISQRLDQVGAVEAGAGDLDENFAGAGRGSGDFDQCEAVIRPRIFDADGFHRKRHGRIS